MLSVMGMLLPPNIPIAVAKPSWKAHPLTDDGLAADVVPVLTNANENLGSTALVKPSCPVWKNSTSLKRPHPKQKGSH